MTIQGVSKMQKNIYAQHIYQIYNANFNAKTASKEPIFIFYENRPRKLF